MYQRLKFQTLTFFFIIFLSFKLILSQTQIRITQKPTQNKVDKKCVFALIDLGTKKWPEIYAANFTSSIEGR